MPTENNKKIGSFITLEGGDGSGKSTQLKKLTDYLVENGYDCVFTREPGGTKISEEIRKIILDGSNVEMTDKAESLLYAAAREQLVDELILPSVKAGKLVVCDRYLDSSIAYQGYGRELGEEYVKSINAKVIERCMPEVTLFFDISPAKAFERKGGEDKDDRLEQSGRAFHERVYKGYKTLAENNPKRIAAIDAGKSVEEVFGQVLKVLKERNIIR